MNRGPYNIFITACNLLIIFLFPFPGWESFIYDVRELF